jgi:hypothetical protein
MKKVEEMLGKAIAVMGYEHPATVWFIQFCEENPNADVNKLEKLLEALVDLVNCAEME